MNDDLATLFGDRDPASYEPATDFDVLPPGKYPVLIESAELKRTKAGTGNYLGLVLLVVDGPSKNRKLFDNINLQNPNDTCEEIGRRTFAALCLAVGAPVTDTTQLLNKVVVAHVKVKDNQNNVRTYSAPDQPVTPQVSAPVATRAPAPVQSAPVTPVVPVAPVAPPELPQTHVPGSEGSRPWDR